MLFLVVVLACCLIMGFVCESDLTYEALEEGRLLLALGAGEETDD
jgi:hypothetical protein